MGENSLVIDTPLGDVKIPFSEEAILALTRRIVKENESEATLFDEDVMAFFDLNSQDETESEWSFWEDTRVPVKIYDMIKWFNKDFTILDTSGYSLSKKKMTNIQYHQFDYPQGKEKKPIRATYFLIHNSSGIKYVVDFNPIDGLHMEVQVVYQPEIGTAERFNSEFDEYSANHGILKGAVVNAKLEFIKLEEVGWDDIVLSPDQKKMLDRNIVRYIENLPLYAEKNLPTSRGCLITGPPGTGKTLTCSAIMNQVESSVIYITSDEVGERGQISELYEVARKISPTIVIVEDIDTLGAIDRTANGDHPLLGEFLNCLGGAVDNKGVITIATTNYPEYLDKALTDRPGRFDFRIDFGLPDKELRKHIIDKYLQTVKHGKVRASDLIRDTEGMTGAHLKEMVMMAYMDALEDSNYNNKTEITQKHLVSAMKTIATNRAKYSFYQGNDDPAFTS